MLSQDLNEKKIDKNVNMKQFWGLITMEEIPSGAFVCEYLGEVITKKKGDTRGTYYDRLGFSYLYDMNDPNSKELYE